MNTPRTILAAASAAVVTFTALAAEPPESEPPLSEVTVTTTRIPRRIADEPTRVEVIDHEELEEKVAMSPGDVAMLFNETSGLHVQTTAPGLGAANVRIQGLRGRYSQILADGLPRFQRLVLPRWVLDHGCLGTARWPSGQSRGALALWSIISARA